MFKVLFISPAKLFLRDRRIELGLTGKAARASVSLQAMTVLGALKKDYETYFIDVAADGFDNEEPVNRYLCKFGLQDVEIAKQVREINPDVILVPSMFAVEQVTVDELCTLLKKTVSKTPIIVGGLHASMKPEWHLENNCIDYIVLGEGEATIKELLTFAPERKGRIEEIDGIAYKDLDDKIIVQYPKCKLENLDAPWEFEKILFNSKGDYRYTQNKVNRSKLYEVGLPNQRVAALYTSRGCPFACSYCCNSRRDGLKIRHMGAERLLKDLKFLHEKYRVNIFQNETDALGLHKEDLLFLEKVAAYRKKHPEIVLVNTNSFFLRIFFDEKINVRTEFINLLSEAGFRVLTISIETFCQRFNKKIDFSEITLKKIKELFATFKEKGLKSEIYMMYCFPSQTKQELVKDKESINELLEFADSVIWRNLNYFPGSQYYKEYFEGKKIEKIYREKIKEGISFYNLTDFFNLSNIETADIRKIIGCY